MTEYEIASLANEFRTLIAGYGTTMLTTTTAFLVAGYVAAHRLNWIMIAVVILIFTYWFWTSVMIAFTVISEFLGLASQIADMARQGTGLSWHMAPAAVARTSVAGPLGLVMTAIIYAASLIFFFHCRRMNHKVAAEPNKPA